MSAPILDAARVVEEARRWLGTPYRHGASLLGVGCDCLGLVAGVYRALIGPLPTPLPAYAPGWAETACGEPLLEAARLHLIECEAGEPAVGDVLAFRWRETLPAKHLAILTAPGRMIHAHDGACVAEVALVPAWRRRLAGRFAFPATVTAGGSG